MFPDFSDTLGLSISRTNHKSILISDTLKSDGSFVLHHLISLYLKSGLNVCVLSLAQSFHHYFCVHSKLNNNLKHHKDSGQLLFIDGLQLVRELQNSSGKETENETKTISPFDFLNDLGFASSLKPLYFLLQENLRHFLDQDKPFLLVVDDLSVLTSLCVPVKDVMIFLQYCRNLMKSGCLAALIQVTDDEDSSHLWINAAHTCSILINVSELKTGSCKEIHGQLKVTWKETYQKQEFQYQVEERNVRLFAPGMSSAVL